jgi:uncharacterized membrane protein required for colicin V production
MDLDVLADLVFIGLIVLFIISGFRRGFVRALFDLVGGIAALILAISYWQNFAALLGENRSPSWYFLSCLKWRSRPLQPS